MLDFFFSSRRGHTRFKCDWSSDVCSSDLSHLAVHMLDGATLAHGLSDSPAGLLAWLLERWNAWSDNGGDVEAVFTKDDMLTHATIYWVNNSSATSRRSYATPNRYPRRPAP